MCSLREIIMSPSVKQILIALSSQLAALSVGGAVSYPSVLLQQLQTADSSIRLDMDTASWIGSIHGLGGIASIVMPTFMQWKGRKFAFIVACLVTTIGWILAFVATNTTAILISEVFHGFGTNSLLTVSLMCMSEFVDPKYRNMTMRSYGTFQTFGMALGGIMSKYVYWRTVSIIMCIPMIFATAIAFMWPESPSWLACKGEFDKCQKAFTSLRGDSDRSKNELNELISAQKEILSVKNIETVSYIHFWHRIKSRDFYVPSIHIFALLNLIYWSGGLVIIIYSNSIVEKATGNHIIATYGGIIINCILFTGVTISAMLAKYFKNKTILLCSTCGNIVCLLSACVVSYMQSVELLSKDSLLCLYCLVAYMISSSLGVHPVTYDIAAELMPVKHRGFGGVLYTIFACLLHASSLKLSPYLFFYINLWGTLLLYTINATICGLFIWKYVPETKNRTLQEIEDFYMFGGFGKRVNKDVIDAAPMLKC